MKAKWPWPALILLAAVGCTLTQSGLRKTDLLNETDLGANARGGGPVIMPKRCALRMMIAERPAGDEALGRIAWSTADPQAVGDEQRRALTANGLRVGRIVGELPPEVRDVLDAPPPRKIEPMVVVLPEGESTLVDLGAHAPKLDLFLSRDGRAVGKVYEEARGFVRVTATHEGASDVSVRIVPELHHGPIRQGWTAAPGGSSFAPRQFVMHNGQAEETFRDLAATLTLRPGQVAVIGTLPGRRGSLGGFLFAAPEANSDRPSQRVLFLWASRSDADTEGPTFDAPPELVPVDPPAEPDRPVENAEAAPVAGSPDPPWNR